MADMSSTLEDKAYEDGVEAGKRGGLFEDFVQALAKGFGGRRSDIFDKGYKWGAMRRDYSSKDGLPEKATSDVSDYCGLESGGGGGGGGGDAISGVLILALVIAPFIGATWLVWRFISPTAAALLLTVFYVWMLVDCIRREPKGGKVIWALVILCLGPIGSFIYFYRKVTR
jgi:hypothetical protein